MLPRLMRLTQKPDFELVYRKGKRVSTKNLYLCALRLSDWLDQNTTRFGFVVSKKSAVKIARRNQIKRILRSLAFFQLAKIPKGRYYIISAKQGIDKISRKEISTQFQELFDKYKP